MQKIRNIKFEGRVHKFDINDRETWPTDGAQYIDLTGSPAIYMRMLSTVRGKDLRITIQDKFRKRTLDQNALYWAGVVHQAKSFWEEREGRPVSGEEIHEFHLSHVLGLVPVERALGGITHITYQLDSDKLKDIADGLEITIKKEETRSSKMSVEMFTLLIEACVRWYAEEDFKIKLDEDAR